MIMPLIVIYVLMSEKMSSKNAKYLAKFNQINVIYDLDKKQTNQSIGKTTISI